MCLLLANEVIGGNELHRNVLVSVLAFRGEEGNLGICLAGEFSNSPSSSDVFEMFVLLLRFQ